MTNVILDFLSKIPYSIPHIIGFFLIIQSILFYEVSKRSKDNYSLLLSLGLLLLGVAWGTTEYQNTGKLYVDWLWWWAQPFFAFGILFVSVGVVRYLPLEKDEKRKLIFYALAFPVIYIVFGTVALIFDFQIERAFIIWMQLPPFFAISFATFKAERQEPKKGHRLIGLLALVVPLLSIIYPILGLKTAELRFWTAVPLLALAAIILAASLLREREKIEEGLDELKIAEEQLVLLNKDLENKVVLRTAMLHDIITDLESFNRSVSHDLRSPLGTISITAAVAEKYLSMGKSDLVLNELKNIKHQVDDLHDLVGTMLNLASNDELSQNVESIKFNEFINDRLSALMVGFKRNYPFLHAIKFEVDDIGFIRINRQLFNIIVDNLVDNAVKYNAMAPELNVKIGGEFVGDKLKIYVSDNGVGISTETNQQDVFKPFKRVSDDVSTLGFGLGLNIVKRAVKKLGGEVWYEPTPGGGVTFYFTILQTDSLSEDQRLMTLPKEGATGFV
jgi:signal transduction histidine kinase